MDEYKGKLIQMDEKTKNFKVLAEKIKKKHPGSNGPANTRGPSTHQLLIDFMKEQRKFNDEQKKFNEEQRRINQIIINRLGKVENELYKFKDEQYKINTKLNIKLDNIVKLNNLKTN